MKASSGGGLVTALRPLITSQDMECIYVSAAISDADRLAARRVEESQTRITHGNAQIRYVVVSQEQYNDYYNGIANPILWFVQHGMWNSPYTPNVDKKVWSEWENGYVPVNKAFARAIIQAADQAPDAPIKIEDYHLYLVPGEIRKARPEAVIQHFMHIPWSGPFCLRTLLPEEMVLPILESLLCCNIIGFQTERDVKAFLGTCEEYLSISSTTTTTGEQAVVYNGRTTLVRAYPISIDVEETRALAHSAEAEFHIEELRPYLAEKTIVRVDRLDPSKNIIRGFMAYERLLGQHLEELRGKVSFIAILVPSRGDIEAYRDYRSNVENTIERINNLFGGNGWEPIKVFFEENQARAFAAMRMCDVLMVNPVADGMNLVAKEGVVISERDSVLVLSRSAGAFQELGFDALAVDPVDTEGMYKALYTALCMSAEERKRRSLALREVVEKADIHAWLSRQFADIAEVMQTRMQVGVR